MNIWYRYCQINKIQLSPEEYEMQSAANYMHSKRIEWRETNSLYCYNCLQLISLTQYAVLLLLLFTALLDTLIQTLAARRRRSTYK